MDEISVDFMLLAQDVEQVHGALTIWRGGMRTLLVPSFPFAVPNISAAIGLQFPRTVSTHMIIAALTVFDTTAGELIPTAPNHMTLGVGQDPYNLDEPTHIVMGLSLYDVEFTHEGPYAVRLEVNGNHVASAPLKVIARE